MKPWSDPLAAVVARLRDAGLHVKDAAYFAPEGILAWATTTDSGWGFTVIDEAIAIYVSDGGLELRVTQHGGPHWIRGAADPDEACAIARAFLARPRRPPGDGWREAP